MSADSSESPVELTLVAREGEAAPAGVTDDGATDEVIRVEVTDVLDALPKTALARFDPVQKVLANMKAELDGYVPDMETTAGEKKARDYRKTLVKIRTGTEKIYETLNAPMLKAQREARDLKKLIVDTAAVYEKPIDEAIKAKEAKDNLEKQRKAEEEAARVAAIQQRIKTISDVPGLVVEMSSEEISAVIEDVQAMDLSDERFAEFVPDAVAARDAAIPKLESLRDAAASREALAKQLADQQERQRQEAERLQKQADEIARIGDLRAKIVVIRSKPIEAMGKTSGEVDAIVQAFAAPDLAEYAELHEEALQAHGGALAQLKSIAEHQRSIEQAASSRAIAEKAAAEQRQEQQDAFEADRVKAEEQTRQAAEQRSAEAADLLSEQRRLEAASEPVTPEEYDDESTMPASQAGDASLDLAIQSGGQELVERVAEMILDTTSPVDEEHASINAEASAVDADFAPPIVTDSQILAIVAQALDLDLGVALARIRAMDFYALAADLGVPA